MTLEESIRARVATAMAGLSYRRALLVAEAAEELIEEEHRARARFARRAGPLSPAAILAEVTGKARP